MFLQLHLRLHHGDLLRGGIQHGWRCAQRLWQGTAVGQRLKSRRWGEVVVWIFVFFGGDWKDVLFFWGGTRVFMKHGGFSRWKLPGAGDSTHLDFCGRNETLGIQIPFEKVFNLLKTPQLRTFLVLVFGSLGRSWPKERALSELR